MADSGLKSPSQSSHSLPRRTTSACQIAALILAAARGDTGTVHTLLASGSDPNPPDNDQKTALIWAATIASDKIVRELLPKIEADEAKEPALEQAANEGQFSVAEMLHENIKDHVRQASVVPKFCFRQLLKPDSYPQVLDKFIERSNQKDGQDRTALMVAVENRNWQLVTALLRLNPKTGLQDTNSRTVLMIATISGHVEVVK
ncbi:hypothetical protein BP6252_06534 [Coleophoma cylindrospora]|uniref:Uncharacterized protein n=1 Tax=Coleophoma cylindrospora TaxID=1849047 RepID=A0A3D8RMS1_9HELO|nr:hypothetical protein BP6252_06534 [Coleophoma cylindrospora]